MQERRTTFWSLYAQDRKYSLSIGRPAAINDLDISVTDPEEIPELMALVRLSRISNKVYYSIYSSKKGSLADFSSRVTLLREELEQFHSSLSPINQFPLSEAELQNSSMMITAIQMIVAFGKFVHQQKIYDRA
jgi:hypothetical protein